ncbi:hypothetical protein EB796_015652 [Bugula neritina]|uniref:Uncharacterized protein n=1 Tax=Bugula neritina TaxID=10212 RepID=A0A7J7JJQ6_BUGNE|nr:hypothetical protein EB796_015652 [Bugula neritina]
MFTRSTNIKQSNNITMHSNVMLVQNVFMQRRAASNEISSYDTHLHRIFQNSQIILAKIKSTVARKTSRPVVYISQTY